MSLTITTRTTHTDVTVGGELDEGGRRGFVLLELNPSDIGPAQLTREEARTVARALLRFADRARPAPKARRTPKLKVTASADVVEDTIQIFRALDRGVL
jgi:hypothetical protein